MELVNNSTIATVIDYANVKFGMELTKEQVADQLKKLSFSETLKLINSMKADDDDAFSDIIDLSAMNEGWSFLPPIDKEKYQARDGLEGPFQTKSGKVVYYDPKEGSYYDPDTDMYMSYDEWKELDEGVWDTVKSVAGKVGNAVKKFVTPGAVKQAQKKPMGNKGSIAKQINMPGFNEEEQIDEYGTINTAQPSRATIRAGKENNDVATRRANNINQDMNRDSKVIGRTVAGGNKQPTGQGAVRAGSADPDDIERANNAQTAGQAANQSNINAQEIERLKQLAMGR